MCIEILEFKIYTNLYKIFFMVAMQKYSLVTSQNFSVAPESGAEGDVDEESLRVRSQVKRRVECKHGCSVIL